MDRADIDRQIRELIAPFNKNDVTITEETTFQGDLEFDSLTVMDFVAAIEDEFDIIISMNQQAEIDRRIRDLIEPFNKNGVTITDATTFQGDLEFDSLTVMDFVAAIEDEFDIIISMNQQAEIETYGQLVDAVKKLVDAG